MANPEMSQIKLELEKEDRTPSSQNFKKNIKTNGMIKKFKLSDMIKTCLVSQGQRQLKTSGGKKLN